MKNFKSKIKQVLAIILSSAMLLGNVNVYAVDSIILKEEKYDESETLTPEESTEASIIEDTEIESINSESEVNESNSTESEEANDNAIISTNSLDEFSNEVAALVSEDVETDSTYATKRLIVLSNTSDFDTYNAVSTISYDNLYILSYDTEKDCKKAYKALSDDSTITSVEVDTIVKSVGSIQTDSYDNLENTDIKYSKLSAFLRMQPTDKNIVKVAILDSGIDLNAKEFTNKIINLNLNYSNSGTPNSIIDDYGHGTNIASIIAQHTYSNVKLMPIKITNNEGKGSILSLYMGIESAIQNNANVINISLSCYSTKDSAIINAAIDKAVSKGIIVVTSAGNDNANTKSYIPANNDNVFTISSVNKNLQKSNFSNYGDNVDYCMLGEGISCLGLESSYATYSGTSYSTALFTSIVSQLKACDLSYTKEDISNILDTYVYDIGDNGIDKYYGKGLLSYNAIIENNGNEQIDDTIVIELNINDVLNWKELSDEKLQDYIYYGSDKNNAYFIQNLSESDLEYILNKNTDLNKDVNYDNYDGLYYEYLMTIDLDTVESNATYVSSNGYVIFNIKGGPNGNSKIKINMSINNKSNGAAQQNVSWSLTTDGSYSNKHSFALTDTATKSRPGKKDNKKANDYNVMVCYCQYTIPAYYKVSSYSSDKKGGGTQRLNFDTYSTANNNEGWQNNGTCTVNTETNLTSNTVDKLTLQINARFTGLEYADNGMLVHGEYTINLIHDHTAYLHDSSNATCTSASTENYYCSTCGAYLSTTHNTAALGHTWPGYWSYDGSNHWQICGRAGDAYMYNPEAHRFVASVIRNATCTTKGVHRYTCSTCGYYYDSEDIAALGHSWPSDFSYADSNNVTNGMAYKNCTRCGTRLDTQYKVHLFHSTYGDVIASSVNTSTGKTWYHAGDSVTVIGSALDGFVWTGWSGDGYDIQSSSQTYTFTMPAKAVRGWGRAIYYSSTLTINPNGGSWNGSINTQSFTQNRGTTKSIPIPTRTGYTFIGWTRTNTYGNMSSLTSASTYTFGPTNNVTDTITAQWKANKYPQTIQVRYENVDGTFTAYETVLSEEREYDSIVTWSRPADIVYQAASVSYKVSKTSETVTKVDVLRNRFTVTINKGTGIDSVIGNGTYRYGQIGTIIATPATGYHWQKWTGYESSTNNPLSLGEVKQNRTYTANAVLNSSTLTINPNSGVWNGSSETQSFTQKYNTTKSIAIPTKEGYTFTGWTKSNPFNGSMSTLIAATTYTYGPEEDAEDTLTANWKINQYTVTYIDVIDSTSGKELGRTTKQVNFNSTVKGSDIGSSTTDNTYYNGYYYNSCTSAIVTTNGATVYRIFKLRTIDVSGQIIWDDKNNKTGSRPDSVILHISSSDGNKYDITIKGDNTQNTNINNWDYSKTLPKYDENGKVLTYTISQDKAISKENGIEYLDPVVNGFDITNTAFNDVEDKTSKVETFIVWNDDNNIHGFRPETITIKLLQNGTTIKTVEIPTTNNTYTFSDLPIFDENFDAYEYTITSSEADRYTKVINSKTYTITYGFQEPVFSIVIPKTVILDGKTGIGEYKITVKGIIDNRDNITVIPERSFIMRNEYLSDVIATVKQSKNTFTNADDLLDGTFASGTVKADTLAGEWSGDFNFKIKFNFGS